MQTNYQTASLLSDGIITNARPAAEARKRPRKRIARSPATTLVQEWQSLTQSRGWEELAWAALGVSALGLLVMSLA